MAMNKKFVRLSAVFAVVYFFSLNGLAGLPNLSINFILKDRMHLSAAGLAYFQALTLLAWVVKPFWGFISDSFPIGGFKRKPYLLITSGLALFSWIGLAMIHTLTFPILLGIVSIAYLGYAFQDVVIDGLMIDVGKSSNLTGQFQSIQWCSVYAAMIITAVGGGYVSDLARKGLLSYNRIFLITALFPLITIIVSTLWVQEEKQPAIPQRTFKVKNLLLNKEIWIISLFLFFWNFSPSFGSPFFYYSVDTLKFSGSFFGILQAVTSVGSLLGGLLFGKFILRIPIRKFLIGAVFAGIGAILFNGIYFLPNLLQHPHALKALALLSNFVFGVLNTVIFLALLNLSAKVCPQDAGATTFAFLMSFYNLGLMGSSALGGLLFPLVGLKMLILMSAFFSLLVLPLMPYLPINEELTGFEKALQGVLRKLRPR
ncbi:MAG: hypothetical protein EXS63_02595 [Candidatus Omnitrophica bacterium]|nr:hypothetical protein [Candidatus Omnitrophota bacterium]